MANPKAETESHRHQSSNIVYWPKSRCDQWHLLICACEICPTLAGMLLEELCDWAGLFLFFSSHFSLSGMREWPYHSWSTVYQCLVSYLMLEPQRTRTFQNPSAISLLSSRLSMNEISEKPGKGIGVAEREHWEEVGGSVSWAAWSPELRAEYSVPMTQSQEEVPLIEKKKKIIEDEGSKMSFWSIRSRFLNIKVRDLVLFF